MLVVAVPAAARPFWLKPNLLQCHSSYVCHRSKGSIVVECRNALLKNGYKLKILNTINFSRVCTIIPSPRPQRKETF